MISHLPLTPYRLEIHAASSASATGNSGQTFNKTGPICTKEQEPLTRGCRIATSQSDAQPPNMNGAALIQRLHPVIAAMPSAAMPTMFHRSCRLKCQCSIMFSGGHSKALQCQQNASPIAASAVTATTLAQTGITCLFILVCPLAFTRPSAWPLSCGARLCILWQARPHASQATLCPLQSTRRPQSSRRARTQSLLPS